MNCTYTAQGNIICDKNIEHYRTVTYPCFGYFFNKEMPCKTCRDVKQTYGTRSDTKFDAITIPPCKMPLAGRNWLNNCSRGGVNKDGIFGGKNCFS